VQGTIAQLLALAIHGNAFLCGRDIAGFYPGNTAFRFCEFVRFVKLSRDGSKWIEEPYAPNPMEWLSCLQTDGAQSVRVIHVPTDTAQLGEHAISDRMSVGFIGGGGRWLLEVSKKSGCEYWEANWNVGDKDREDKLIWQVSYGRVAANQPRHDSDGPSMHEVHALLASTLEAIRGFAQTHALGGFASSFEAALTALRSEAPLGIAFHSDIAPDGLLSRRPDTRI
jgi:hypothetical protein